MTMGGMDAESSAKGLLVSINLPQSWPVIVNARTDGMAALKKSAVTHRMRRPDFGRAAGHAAANDGYGLAAGTPLGHQSRPFTLPNNGLSDHRPVGRELVARWAPSHV